MKITPEIILDFRGYFNGQYSDVQKFSDDFLYDLLCDAASETGGDGWGDFSLGECGNFRRRGMYYYAAHLIEFIYSGDPSLPIAGQARLNTQSKQVGDESTSYRVAAMMDAGNDALTYTVFGQQFYRLRKRAYTGARAL